jgi:hypothetical protein
MTSQKPSIASFMLGVAALLATSAAWSADKLESTNPAGWSQQAQIQVAAQHDHGARAGLSSLSAIKPGPEASCSAARRRREAPRASSTLRRA